MNAPEPVSRAEGKAIRSHLVRVLGCQVDSNSTTQGAAIHHDGACVEVLPLHQVLERSLCIQLGHTNAGCETR